MMTAWPERFAQKVRIAGPNECWPWTACKNRRGYGKFCWQGRRELAHRLAWGWSTDREIPVGLCVCHRCDNPACCNPAHLFLGNHRDNVADKVAKGRQLRGEYIPSSTLLPEQVVAIAADPRLQREIAADYGVCRQEIGRIKTKVRWRHATEHLPADRRPRHSKLRPEQVAAIFADRRIQRVIAAEHGVTQSLVSAIKRGRLWGHLTRKEAA